MFYKKVGNKGFTNSLKNANNIFNMKNLNIAKDQNLIQLDLRKYAYMQIINENIPNTNIEISNLCTYESNNEFNSWRRSKTPLRQWNFICP